MYFGRDAGDGGRGGHAADVQQCGEDHACLDRHGQVGEHGQPEGDAPHRCFGGTELDDVWDLAPFAHVVSHDQQNTGKHGERDVSRERSGEQEDEQQRDRMRHACNRRSCPRANVGRGPRDGARCRQPAEER